MRQAAGLRDTGKSSDVPGSSGCITGGPEHFGPGRISPARFPLPPCHTKRYGNHTVKCRPLDAPGRAGPGSRLALPDLPLPAAVSMPPPIGGGRRPVALAVCRGAGNPVDAGHDGGVVTGLRPHHRPRRAPHPVHHPGGESSQPAAANGRPGRSYPGISRSCLPRSRERRCVGTENAVRRTGPAGIVGELAAVGQHSGI
jgi:hypothetical protein